MLKYFQQRLTVEHNHQPGHAGFGTFWWPFKEFEELENPNSFWRALVWLSLFFNSYMSPWSLPVWLEPHDSGRLAVLPMESLCVSPGPGQPSTGAPDQAYLTVALWAARPRMSHNHSRATVYNNTLWMAVRKRNGIDWLINWFKNVVELCVGKGTV